MNEHKFIVEKRGTVEFIIDPSLLKITIMIANGFEEKINKAKTNNKREHTNLRISAKLAHIHEDVLILLFERYIRYK